MLRCHQTCGSVMGVWSQRASTKDVYDLIGHGVRLTAEAIPTVLLSAEDGRVNVVVACLVRLAIIKNRLSFCCGFLGLAVSNRNLVGGKTTFISYHHLRNLGVA